MRSLRELRAIWRRRPIGIPRRIWALILALDGIPWPWSEDIFVGCFLTYSFVRMRGFRKALAWASAQPDAKRNRWRLARSLCSQQGRSVARSALVGIRDPAVLRRHISVRGAEHLRAAGRGVILLGFHLGPRASHQMLRVAGHASTWVGEPGFSAFWSRAIREHDEPPGGDLVLLGRTGQPSGHEWMRLLYRARQILLDGGTVFINADGTGREAFSVPVPGGRMVIRKGWLALRRGTGAPVLPVLSRMDGRTQVVTIHPALPPLSADPVLDRESCRSALGDLLCDYVRRFPEHCYWLTFVVRPP